MSYTLKPQFVMIVILTFILATPLSASAAYSRTNDSVSVNSCNSDSMSQWDNVTYIGHSRFVLVSTWLPSSLSTTANKDRAKTLAKWADRTMRKQKVSHNSGGSVSRGYAPSEHTNNGYKDYMVITKNALYWFDYSAQGQLSDSSQLLPNGGGGQLRGVWPLTVDGSGLLNFRNIRNASNWAPNQLLPGADGANVQGSGVSGFLTEYQEDNGKTYNVENDQNAYLAYHQPLSTGIAGGSGTLKDEGFFVQSVGKFVDTEPGGDRYSVGNGPNTGYVKAVTSYRIAGCDDKIFIESSWTSESFNKIGPLANVVSATNTYGEYVINRYGSNLVQFSDTNPNTCVTRNTYSDTYTCSTGQEDYRDLLQEHVYRSKPNYDIAPPAMKFLSRFTNGSSANPSLRVYPLSGVSSMAAIFDTHSLTNPTKMVAANDITYFNRSFYEPPVDSRYAVPNYNILPSGMERVGDDYFLSPEQNMTSRYMLEFK